MVVWLKHPRLLWKRFQYLSGLRVSRLVRLTARPGAKMRAVVYGLPEIHWSAFDAAYPEYEKIFAHADVLPVELRLALSGRNMALLVFEGAPRRVIDVVTHGLPVEVFFGSMAPIPILERGPESARGFCIDTMGDWLKARRATEISVFLENFDLSERPRLIEAARNVMGTVVPPPVDGGTMLIHSAAPASGPDGGVDPEAALREAAAVSADQVTVNYREHLYDSWSSPDVVFDFLSKLENIRTVIVADSPLALLAVLNGREVVVTGRPFWAGFGLTRDIGLFKRRRTLNVEEMLGTLVFVLCRYVDEENCLIDPAENWTLPGNAPMKDDIGALEMTA